jgi:hypothetical protein
MRARTALSRLALQPPSLARLLAALVRTGTARLIAQQRVRRVIARRRQDRSPRQDAGFALRVDVTYEDRASHGILAGHTQANAAAAGAASVVRSLLEREFDQPGAWMPEQVIDPLRFFSHLAEHGLDVEFASSHATADGRA